MESILNISYCTDNVDINEAMVYKALVDEGYVYPINELELKKDQLHDFLNQLSRFNMKEYDFSDHNIFKQYKCDAFWMNISGSKKTVYINFNCKNADIGVEVYDIWKQFAPDNDEASVFLTTFYMSNGMVTDSVKIIGRKEFNDVSGMYYPYINVDIMCEQLFSNKENILIFCGKPGTGKTKLSSQIIKYALDNLDTVPYYDEDADSIYIAYVKNTEVLAQDQFWKDLANGRFSFIILDDLDFFLTARDTEVQSQEDIDRNKFINQFLSFTDGIENNRTKFIITTNQPFKDMDVALMRKGRMFDILELRDLTKEEALKIWLKHGLDEAEFPFNDRVLQADLGSMIQKKLNTKVPVTDYIKEKGISKIQSHKRKVGL